MASNLYIATANAPLGHRFQEMLDMLMTGAAFGVPTTLWLTDGCLVTLSALPGRDSLQQLADFGVRCVVSDTAITINVEAETLGTQALAALRNDCQQVLVF